MTLLLAGFGAIAVGGAIGVVASRKTVYSALGLVTNVAAVAVVYLLLNAQFLFAVQLIIYAGAVVVLFIFIIALLNPERADRPVLDVRLIIGIAAVVLITSSMIVLAKNGITTTSDGFRGAQVGAAAAPQECVAAAPTRCHDPYNAFAFTPAEVNAPAAGNIQTTGGQLFTTFLVPFEVTSLLLLVSAIGAVYLTRRSGGAGPQSVRPRRQRRGWTGLGRMGLRDLPPSPPPGPVG